MKGHAAKQLQRWNRETPNVCGGLARRIPQNAEQLARPRRLLSEKMSSELN